ncbi:cell wall-binding repeat-containing protein [Halobacillus kuroshimensis]|uniref:Cell wall-binding repeat-containing protein n=1 Tax=Halobacillus kuroshimensis TaxID=302481 RepID=A0ABS3DRW8_9BACI|nr:cell wall-binding repeat-containing protein [Halobacillus kuroshimensis]
MNRSKQKRRRLWPILFLVALLVFPAHGWAADSTDNGKWRYTALGDSLAYGIQSDGSAGLSYADFLADDLRNVDRLEEFTKAFAVPGLTSEGLLSQMQTNEEAVKSAAEADLITISIGANDFLKVFSKDPDELKNPEVVQSILQNVGENYGKVVHQIRTVNPDAKIFLMGYYNSFPAYPEEDQQQFIQLMNALNQTIQKVASASGSEYVATFEAVADNYDTYLPNPQNVHPGEKGYERIAEEFWKAVKPFVPIATDRIAGENRYETAVEISKQGWDESDTIVLARGDHFPDALAGAPLAYQMDAPILLTKERLPAEVMEEIQRLGADRAVILGGTEAVSPFVENQLKGMGLSVQRIGGKDRFVTAANIAAVLNGNPQQAVVANGMDFPDALAIASYAAGKGSPVLLTKDIRLPDVTALALTDVDASIAVGGTRVISDEVFQALPSAVRYGGENRYETSALIAKELNPADRAFIATGSDFADALTGSILAAKENSTFLLVPPNYLDASIAEAAEELGIRHFTILGGTGAVGPSVTEELMKSVHK